MTQWRCWLDADSLVRFQRELDVAEINNQVTCQASPDALAMHVRQQARDAFAVLALQENPALDRTHVRAVLDQLAIRCEDDTRGAGGNDDAGS